MDWKFEDGKPVGKLLNLVSGWDDFSEFLQARSSIREGGDDVQVSFRRLQAFVDQYRSYQRSSLPGVVSFLKAILGQRVTDAPEIHVAERGLEGAPSIELSGPAPSWVAPSIYAAAAVAHAGEAQLRALTHVDFWVRESPSTAAPSTTDGASEPPAPTQAEAEHLLCLDLAGNWPDRFELIPGPQMLSTSFSLVWAEHPPGHDARRRIVFWPLPGNQPTTPFEWTRLVEHWRSYVDRMVSAPRSSAPTEHDLLRAWCALLAEASEADLASWQRADLRECLLKASEAARDSGSELLTRQHVLVAERLGLSDDLRRMIQEVWRVDEEGATRRSEDLEFMLPRDAHPTPQVLAFLPTRPAASS